jgi:hypothetical protein
MLHFKSARHGGIDLGENDAPLHGRLTHGCALMTDLRNFTPLCEVEDPVIVLGWLKHYFVDFMLLHAETTPTANAQTKLK